MKVQPVGSLDEARLLSLFRKFLSEELSVEKKRTKKKKGEAEKTEAKWQKVRGPQKIESSAKRSAIAPGKKDGYYGALLNMAKKPDTKSTQQIKTPLIKTPPLKTLPPSWQNITLRPEDWVLPVVTATTAFSSISNTSGIFICNPADAVLASRKQGDFSVITHKQLEGSTRLTFPIIINGKTSSRTGWISSYGSTKAPLRTQQKSERNVKNCVVLFHAHKSYFAEKVEVTPDFLMTRARAAYLSAFGEEIDSHLVWPSKQRETSNKIRTVNMRIPCTRVHKLSLEVTVNGPDGYFVTLPKFTQDSIDAKLSIIMLQTNDLQQAKNIGKSLNSPVTFLRGTNKLGIICSASMTDQTRSSLGELACPAPPVGDKYRISGDHVGRLSRSQLWQICNSHGWEISTCTHFSRKNSKTNMRSSHCIVVARTSPPSSVLWADDFFITVNAVSSTLPTQKDFPALGKSDGDVAMDNNSQCYKTPIDTPIGTPLQLPSQPSEPSNAEIMQQLQTLNLTIDGLRRELAAEKEANQKLRDKLGKSNKDRERRSGRDSTDQRPRANSHADMAAQLKHNQSAQ